MSHPRDEMRRTEDWSVLRIIFFLSLWFYPFRVFPTSVTLSILLGSWRNVERQEGRRVRGREGKS